MVKQLSEIFDKIESSQIELNTFQELLRSEMGAIPKRLEVPSTAGLFKLPSSFGLILQFFGNFDQTNEFDFSNSRKRRQY